MIRSKRGNGKDSKLQLHDEVIRTLDSANVAAVVGGGDGEELPITTDTLGCNQSTPFDQVVALRGPHLRSGTDKG